MRARRGDPHLQAELYRRRGTEVPDPDVDYSGTRLEASEVRKLRRRVSLVFGIGLHGHEEAEQLEHR
jgi:hypothetical protein